MWLTVLMETDGHQTKYHHHVQTSSGNPSVGLCLQGRSSRPVLRPDYDATTTDIPSIVTEDMARMISRCPLPRLCLLQLPAGPYSGRSKLPCIRFGCRRDTWYPRYPRYPRGHETKVQNSTSLPLEEDLHHVSTSKSSCVKATDGGLTSTPG